MLLAACPIPSEGGSEHGHQPARYAALAACRNLLPRSPRMCNGASAAMRAAGRLAGGDVGQQQDAIGA
jgi:hypothetical protein